MASIALTAGMNNKGNAQEGMQKKKKPGGKGWKNGNSTLCKIKSVYHWVSLEIVGIFVQHKLLLYYRDYLHGLMHDRCSQYQLE